MSIMMNEPPMSTMLSPYDPHHIPSPYYEHPHHLQQQVAPRFYNRKVPKVVEDQKGTFETDELFRKLARESEHIIYTPAYMHKKENKDIDDKLRQRFMAECKDGCTEIVFTSSGIVLQLNFTPSSVDFASSMDSGKVRIKSNYMILNGVCVRWKGVIDLQTLSGVGCIEYDDENARIEDVLYVECQQIKKQLQQRNLFKNFSAPAPGPTNIKVE